MIESIEEECFYILWVGKTSIRHHEFSQRIPYIHLENFILDKNYYFDKDMENLLS